MKAYNKPEITIDEFEVIDVVTLSNGEVEAGTGNDIVELSAGLEFDVSLPGDEF